MLIVDDHPLVRDAMAQLLLHLAADVRVLQAADCIEGLQVAARNPDVDLVLLDFNLPGLCGVAALERFRREHPAAPVVVVSALRDRATVMAAIQRGAMGYVPKSANRDEILAAFRLVLAGHVYVPPQAAAEVWADDTMRAPTMRGGCSAVDLGLTERQAQVLAFLMNGKANKQICRELGLAEGTVKVHITAVLNALRVSSRTQAVIAATRLGLDAERLMYGSRAGEPAKPLPT